VLGVLDPLPLPETFPAARFAFEVFVEVMERPARSSLREHSSVERSSRKATAQMKMAWQGIGKDHCESSEPLSKRRNSKRKRT
jgi:hypothetical protein